MFSPYSIFTMLHGDHKDDNDEVDDDGIMIALIMMTRLMMVKVTLIA